jgi:tetratricopeptide (TPR) repeat protein
MTYSTPSKTTNTDSSPVDGELHSGQGVGSGAGSPPPPESGGPAEANDANATTSALAVNSRFNSVSPIQIVSTLSAGHVARTPHDSPVDPASHALWRHYLIAGHLFDAAQLCRERLLSTESEAEQACWVKDLSIVKLVSGEYEAASDLLLSIRHASTHFQGPFRGRIEVTTARAFEKRRQFDTAFEHYTAAHYYASPDSYLAAQIDTNTGRCYTAANNPEASFRYFDRAELSADTLLLAQIEESRALAHFRLGDRDTASLCAAHALYLAKVAGSVTEAEEARRTLDKIEGRER